MANLYACEFSKDLTEAYEKNRSSIFLWADPFTRRVALDDNDWIAESAVNSLLDARAQHVKHDWMMATTSLVTSSCSLLGAPLQQTTSTTALSFCLFSTSNPKSLWRTSHRTQTASRVTRRSTLPVLKKGKDPKAARTCTDLSTETNVMDMMGEISKNTLTQVGKQTSSRYYT